MRLWCQHGSRTAVAFAAASLAGAVILETATLVAVAGGCLAVAIYLSIYRQVGSF